MRVDLATMGQNSYVKYNFRYITTSPSAQYRKTGGIRRGLTGLNTAASTN